MRSQSCAQTSHVATWCARSRNTTELGRSDSFAEHGFGLSRSYELVWDERRYPHKAILGTAYEFATGDRLGSSDFEGGKSGAVAVLRDLGFTIQEKR